MNYLKKIAPLAVTATVLALAAPCAFAQPPVPNANAEATQNTAAQNARLRPLNTIVTVMARTSGATILADSSVAATPVMPLTEASTADNFEAQLDGIVKAMPQGATWAKVYLPLTSSRMNADAVSDYVIAQAKLFGSAGAAAPAGMVEIMGQRVPADKAQAVITALNLKPIYLISNPLLKAAAQNWGKLSAEQQKQYASQQAQQILSMDPTQQAQMFQQQMAVFGSMMQQMTPEQRQGMMQNFGNMRRPGQGGDQ